MTRLVFAKGSSESFRQLTSRRLQDKLIDLLDLIEEVPTFGSRNVRDSLKLEYGEGIMKANLAPFALIYEYDEEADTAYIYGLIHMHSIQ